MTVSMLFIILLITFLALLPLVTPFQRDLQEVLTSQHPTDDEFIQQIGSKVSPDVALKVRRIVADVSCYDIDEIWPDTNLGDVLDLSLIHI